VCFVLLAKRGGLDWQQSTLEVSRSTGDAPGCAKSTSFRSVGCGSWRRAELREIDIVPVGRLRILLRALALSGGFT
jgi:hypothetical protein